MARKRHRYSRSSSKVAPRTTRRLQTFANRQVVVPQRKLIMGHHSWIENRRFTAPTIVRKMRPIYTVQAQPAVTRERYKNGRFQTTSMFPDMQLRLCVRRRVRREVMFSKSGGKAIRRKHRYNRRTAESRVSC